MSRVLVLLLFLTAGVAHATDPVFEAARYGTAPQMNFEQFYAAKSNLLLSLSHYRSRFIENALAMAQAGGKCRRYSIAVQKVFAGLQSTLAQIPRNEPLEEVPDAYFESRIRFSLLQLAAINLFLLAQNGDEAGVSNIDPDAHAKCDFRDRDELVKGFADQIAALNAFNPKAFGTPGLLTLDHAGDRLLKLAAKNEHWREIYSVSFFGATLLLAPLISIRIPMLITAGLRAAVGPVSSELLAGETAQALIRSGVLVGTFVGGMYINDKIQPEEDPRERYFGVSWDDHLTQVEALLDSPKTYAQLSLAYLGQQKNIVAQYFRDYLRDHAADLKKEYGPIFDETFAIDLESILLNNRPLAGRILRLQQVLGETYGYQVSCRRGTLASLYWNAVDDVKCLAAIKKVARLAYRNAVPILSLPAKTALSIVITNDSSDLDLVAEPIQLNVNVDDSSDEVLALLSRTVKHPALGQSIINNRRFADLVNTFTLNTGLTISVDPRVKFAERWSGLTKLIEIAQNHPESFVMDADEVRLQTRFSRLGDHGLKLRVGIDTHADSTEIQSYLESERTRPEHGSVVAAFLKSYDEMQWQQKILKDLGFEADCSAAGELTLSACVRTLSDVHGVLTRIGPRFIHHVDIGGIFVRGQDEMPGNSEVTRNRSLGIWVVREGVKPFDLAYFLREHGWLHE